MTKSNHFLSVSLIYTCFFTKYIGSFAKKHRVEISPFQIIKETIKKKSVGTHKKVIVGGVETEIGRYPYMASLIDLYGDTFCGGTLISPEWILSAAHCAGYAKQVHINYHRISDNLQDEQIINVDYEIIHADFDSWTFDNDVMMVKLETSVNFTLVELNTEDIDLSEGIDVTAIGWGVQDECDFSPSDALLEVEVDIVTNEQCNDSYDGDILDSMVCAAREGKDACYGDSGGPLIIKGSTSNEDIQVGIVSWGMGCARPDYPGVYSRISSVYDFINDTIVNDPGPPPRPLLFPNDGFDYTNCTIDNHFWWIGDGLCDGGQYNTAQCNYDGDDCKCENFPVDGFNYTNCNVDSPCRIGNGICDLDPYNSAECNSDGLDCDLPCTSFPEDGFNYSNCLQAASTACSIGNGFCDNSMGFYSEECNFDGGDCDNCPFPNDRFDYSNCFIFSPCWVNDNYCDESSNIAECNFDGGDCDRRRPLFSLISFVIGLFTPN